jgi:hypothetical protein
VTDRVSPRGDRRTPPRRPRRRRSTTSTTCRRARLPRHARPQRWHRSRHHRRGDAGASLAALDLEDPIPVPNAYTARGLEPRRRASSSAPPEHFAACRRRPGDQASRRAPGSRTRPAHRGRADLGRRRCSPSTRPMARPARSRSTASMSTCPSSTTGRRPKGKQKNPLRRRATPTNHPATAAVARRSSVDQGVQPPSQRE